MYIHYIVESHVVKYYGLASQKCCAPKTNVLSMLKLRSIRMSIYMTKSTKVACAITGHGSSPSFSCQGVGCASRAAFSAWNCVVQQTKAQRKGYRTITQLIADSDGKFANVPLLAMLLTWRSVHRLWRSPHWTQRQLPRRPTRW